jgi:hypothetical protein
MYYSLFLSLKQYAGINSKKFIYYVNFENIM